MASIHEVKKAIDAAAAGSGFRCMTVSWEDAQRGHTSGGGLSSVGPNISDVRLYEKTGRLLYTVRSDNWNERLGYVAARDVAMVTGNEKSTASTLEPTTLEQYLQTIGRNAAYVGCDTPSLSSPELDGILGIRFQTVFLPVEDSGRAADAPPKTEFCTEVYNYQTRSDDDPRNMLLLATPQGTSVQQDGAGFCRLYFHSVDAQGSVHRYWLEAEKSEKAVGGAQKETLEEAKAAAARGKAVAVRLGPSSMGTRFNVQMLIQIPLKQAAPRRILECCDDDTCSDSDDEVMMTGCGDLDGDMVECCYAECVEGAASESDDDEDAFLEVEEEEEKAMPVQRSAGRPGMARAPPKVGEANAARVSRGTEQDVYSGVANKAPERDPSQHGTITVTMYYTVVGGVPSVADVKAAIEDLDQLYKQCASDKRLADCHEVTAPPPAPPVPAFLQGA